MELKAGLRGLLLDVDQQILEVRKEAKAMGISPMQMRQADGNYVLPPLLLAKAQTLNGLALLKDVKG